MATPTMVNYGLNTLYPNTGNTRYLKFGVGNSPGSYMARATDWEITSNGITETYHVTPAMVWGTIQVYNAGYSGTQTYILHCTTYDLSATVVFTQTDTPTLSLSGETLNCAVADAIISLGDNELGIAPINTREYGGGIYGATNKNGEGDYVFAAKDSIRVTYTTLTAPTVSLTDGGIMRWNAINGAQSYTLYKNGAVFQTGLTVTSYTLSDNGEYRVQAITSAQFYYNSALSTTIYYTKTDTISAISNDGILRIIPYSNGEFEIQLATEGTYETEYIATIDGTVKKIIIMGDTYDSDIVFVTMGGYIVYDYDSIAEEWYLSESIQIANNEQVIDMQPTTDYQYIILTTTGGAYVLHLVEADEETEYDYQTVGVSISVSTQNFGGFISSFQNNVFYISGIGGFSITESDFVQSLSINGNTAFSYNDGVAKLYDENGDEMATVVTVASSQYLAVKITSSSFTVYSLDTDGTTILNLQTTPVQRSMPTINSVSVGTNSADETQQLNYVLFSSANDFDRLGTSETSYSFTPAWDGNTFFLAKFKGDLQAGTFTSSAEVGGNVFYRSEGGNPIYEFIANVAANTTRLKDFAIPARTETVYSVYYLSDGTYSAAQSSPTICPYFNSYYLYEGVEDENNENIFHILNAWRFGNNISASGVSNNNTPSFLTNFTPYRLKQPVARIGKSGTLSALLSNVQNSQYANTALQMETFYQISNSQNEFFLKDMLGNLYRVAISGAINQTQDTRTPQLVTTVSFPWEEIGSMEGISLIQLPTDEGWQD